MPYYIYNLPLLRATVREAKRAAGDAVIHFAIKACADRRVLQIIASEGLGADCVSIGEVRKALMAGIPAERIAFAGVGKQDFEIEEALRIGIMAFNVESVEELTRISAVAERIGRVASVCLRINPEVDAHTHEKITTGLADKKFGIPIPLIPEALQVCHASACLQLVGLHFHVGSQILDPAPFRALAERINEILPQFEGEQLQIIDVGGGLGIDYEKPWAHPIPDFEAYFTAYREGLKLPQGAVIHCELGRAIVGQCGSLIAEVVEIKRGLSKRFCVLNAGMNDLVRPAMYDALHQIVPFADATSLPGVQPAEQKHECTATYDVVGPICESSDVFATDYALPEMHIGDRVALLSVGAYGETMASTYNSRPLIRAQYIEEEMEQAERIEQNKKIYLGICRALIHRDGIQKVIEYLNNPNCDFFLAPSSTNYHLNCPGGLCQHSLNVFYTIVSLYEEVLEPTLSNDEAPWSKPISLETLAIVSLFHDFCKINLYKKGERFVKDDETGRWKKYDGYEVKDEFPLGHGEKSIYRLMHLLNLTQDELLAIRWHMGMFDVSSYGQGGFYALREATTNSPLVSLLQAADALASNLLERTLDLKALAR